MNQEQLIQKLEEKVKRLEEKGDLGQGHSSMPNFASPYYGTNPNSHIGADQIDLKSLFSILWGNKLKIVLVSAVFAICSIFYALSLPNIYQSTISLVPTQQESKSGLSSLASKYGGLAAMAGINIGGSEASSIEHAVALMNSWPYLERMVDKYDLKPEIMAVKGWDRATNTTLYDTERFDPETRQWKNISTWYSDEEFNAEPSSFKTFQKLFNMLNIGFDDDKGILTISVFHNNPHFAYKLTDIFVQELNSYFKLEDQKQAEASIAFIENEIEKTNNIQMLEMFYNMIESHTQTIMLTEVNDEYLVKTLIPAKVAEEKVKPKRAIIVVFTTFFGGALVVAYILIMAARKK